MKRAVACMRLLTSGLEYNAIAFAVSIRSLPEKLVGYYLTNEQGGKILNGTSFSHSTEISVLYSKL